MKLKLAFWSAVLLAVLGAHAPESALFYFFATHLLIASAGLLMLRLEQRPRPGQEQQTGGAKSPAAAPKAKAG
jgi:hypothetical protein